MNLKWNIILKKAGMICLATLLFALCSVLIYIAKATGSMQHPDSGPETAAMTAGPKAQDQPDDYWTIGVFGLDSRNGSLGKGNSGDAQILCSINRTTGDIRLVSVYRDTYLLTGPSARDYGKISQSYANQGPEGNVAALSANLDLTIDGYVAFNWKAVADAINLLGGVDIELTKSEFHFINAFITETVASTGVPSTQLENYGMQHLDGVQAVAYMRIRQPDTDFDRTKRQRAVITQMFEKAKSADPGTLVQVVQTILPQTAMSLDQKDLVDMALNMSKYHISAAEGFPFTHQQAPIGKNGDCVIPNTLESNVEQLHEFLYDDKDYTCSDQVKEISREIIKDAVKN